MSQIYVLHYDGVVTGSVELRKYNEDVVSKMYEKILKREQIDAPIHAPKLIDYFNKYDNLPGGKKKEPFFDAFLVHIAFAKRNPEVEYNGNFYYPIDPSRDLANENKGPYSTFRTSNYDVSTRRDNIPGYDDANHIFILSPLSESALANILEAIDSRGDKPLIFHIQGDAIKTPDGTPKNNPPTLGMNGSGGGMFGEAFNMFSGGVEFQTFRETLKVHGAAFYSVEPNAVTTRSADGKVIDPGFYYNRIIQDMLTVCSDNRTVTNMDLFRPLTVHSVYEDGVDKDNLASLALLSKLSGEANMNIPCMFMGLRIYNSSSVPFGPPGGPTPTFWFDGPGKPEGTTDNGFRVHPITMEVEKPADRRGREYGNIEFLYNDTMMFYYNQISQFNSLLQEYFPNKFYFTEGSIVDGTGPISKSLRAPFNFSLFYFAKQTYMDYGVGANNGSAIKSIVVAPQGAAEAVHQGARPNAGSSKSAKLNGGGEYNYELIPLVNYL